MIPPLFKHQKQTIRFGAKTPIIFDTSDPGTGKTRGHLELFAKRLKKRKSKALVVAPKSLLETAWAHDAREFCPQLRLSIAYAENRAKAFEANVDVYITNTDAVVWLAKQKPAFFKDFDTLIVDESSYFKHRTSARSKALAKIVKHFKYRALLSGTPNSRTICDIWHQAYLLDDGERLGALFGQFRSATCVAVPIPGTPHVSWEDKPFAEETVAHLLSDISIRHDFNECIDIPKTHTYFAPFKLNAKHLSKYRELEDTAMLELDSGEVTAVHAAALKQKLLQCASGAVYTGAGDYVTIDTARYELIANLVEQRSQSVVFYSWHHQREHLVKALNKLGLKYAVFGPDTKPKDKNRIVAKFQAGQHRALLMHYKTGAHGLTLTSAATVIWASGIHEADFTKQGMHRIRRAGQKQKTEVIKVCAEKTIERGVYKRAEGYQQRMDNLLDIIRENRK